MLVIQRKHLSTFYLKDKKTLKTESHWIVYGFNRDYIKLIGYSPLGFTILKIDYEDEYAIDYEITIKYLGTVNGAAKIGITAPDDIGIERDDMKKHLNDNDKEEFE